MTTTSTSGLLTADSLDAERFERPQRERQRLGEHLIRDTPHSAETDDMLDGDILRFGVLQDALAAMAAADTGGLPPIGAPTLPQAAA